MALTIKKRFLQQQRRAMEVGVGVVSIVALVGTPLAYAFTVKSPSKNMTNKTSNLISSPVVSDNTANKSLVVPLAQDLSTAQSTDCSTNAPMHTGLSSAHSPQLKKLAQYEQVCGSGIVSQASFFVPTPTSVKEAHEDAQDVIVQLKEFAANGISPLVFLEPTSDAGRVSMADYQVGAFDAALNAYFSDIKNAGITDTQMGTWVPIPEGNLPEWTSVHPDDFAACVTKAVSWQKHYFPSSKASIMLDTLTYPETDQWDGAQAKSLLPYVKNIPAGLIDSFGLQGFPWSPRSTSHESDNGLPKDYLRIDFAAEAARVLNVKDVWLNTGTFATSYAGQKGQVTATPARRLTLLNGVVDQAKSLQSQGFTVSVHLFAQDKSQTSEAIDWSYWQTGKASTSSSTDVFKAFTHSLQASNIPLWLFDTDEQN